MAIKYLGGGIVEGHSNPNNIIAGLGTEQIDTDFSDNSAWTQVGTKWRVNQQDYVNCTGYSSYAPNDYCYYDLGSGFHACDQDFVLRCKIKAVGAGGYVQVGFTDLQHKNSGDALYMGLNTYGTAYGYTRIYDYVNGTNHEVETASSTTPSGMYNTAIYMEFAFNSTTNVGTVKCFSDSGFTTPLNASTQNLSHTLTMSDYQGLRYLFVGSIDASGRTLDSGCLVDDLTLHTGSTTITSDKSTITNVPIGTRYHETDTKKIFRMGKDLVSGANLKVYLKFDEASGTIQNVAGDVTGNATLGDDADLTQTGGTYAQTTPSALGNGLLYDGTNDYGVCSTGSNTTSQFNFMHNTSANFTVCVWLKYPNSVGSRETLIDTYAGNDANVGMRITTSPAGHFDFTVARGSGNTFVIYTDGNPQLYIPTDNEWHFYCFRYDYTEGSDALIYSVDGATSGTYYQEFALGWYGGGTPNTAVNSDAFESLTFGADRLSSLRNWGNFVASEFSLWNRRLTPAEVTKIYNSGAGFQLDTGLPLWVEKGTA